MTLNCFLFGNSSFVYTLATVANFATVQFLSPSWPYEAVRDNFAHTGLVHYLLSSYSNLL